MTKEELERKSETEGLTAEEVTEYQRLVKPIRHVYGKYGTIKKKYLEEHDWIKTAALGKDLPEYLHAIDRAADDLYETMYEKLKKDETSEERETSLRTSGVRIRLKISSRKRFFLNSSTRRLNYESFTDYRGVGKLCSGRLADRGKLYHERNRRADMYD